MTYIQLTPENIESEHICCAFSDKKCRQSYELKKQWLKKEFKTGYVFYRLDERAKVFIEYGPAETAWAPVTAPNHLLINCFWVSGKYKKNGHGKTLLQHAVDNASAHGKDGLVTVVGTKKFHFMSDTRWLLKQGFQECDRTDADFSLLVRKLNPDSKDPEFNASARTGTCPEKKGVVAYYSNRCPFSEYHVKESLSRTTEKRGIPFKAVKLKTMAQAQSSPTPATVFSLFYKGRFVTTDISICMDNRFDKLMEKCKGIDYP
ncbi:MAG: GNAT family N-acetyltransferase [Desulfobacterales bacterium]|nr:GNAT family N-acetyltransferase [Desulfobacterales bacterium]